MAPERWQEVETIFHMALECNGDERGRFLQERCGSDDALRAEVESLLDHQADESLIDGSAADIVAKLFASEPALSVGDQVGPFRIEGELGSGGMGRVYRARDTRLNRTVALKVCEEEFSDRFGREARAIAALSHPNICHLYDVGPNYLVMELVDGSPLKGPLALDKVVLYAEQILDAIDAAHRKGIVHRDLKPANILVTRQGVKILDFGLAKQAIAGADLENTVTQSATVVGSILGTLQYMSPEQAQGKDADARSDLFSFGCVLYEMLGGTRAFDGDNPAAVIAAILRHDPTPLPTTPALDRVLRACLEKDPERRFQSAVDAKRALQWAAEQPDLAMHMPKRRWWIGVMAASALLGFGASGLFRAAKPPANDRVLRFEVAPPKGGRLVPGAPGLSLSPNGDYLTYLASVNGKIGLWLHALDGSADDRLLSDKPTRSLPFWSPDEKSIGFVAESRLWRLDLAGGAAVGLAEQSPQRGAAWTSDHRILFPSRQGLMQIPDSGGSLSVFNRSDAGVISQERPQLLPNGRYLQLILFARSEDDGIFAASLAKPSKRVRVLATQHPVLHGRGLDGTNYLIRTQNSSLVAQEFDIDKLRLRGEPYTIAQTGGGGPAFISAALSQNGVLAHLSLSQSSTLTWMDRSGRSIGAVGEAGNYSDFRLSPDGQHVAITRPDPESMNTVIWLFDLKRQILSRLTSIVGLPRYPVWSPDGNTVVFGDQRSLFSKEVGALGQEVRLTDRGRRPVSCDWSRDGRFILFSEPDPDLKQDLWLLPVPDGGKPSPGQKPIPYLRTPYDESSGRFSPEPNPHWVAYQSDETGRSEIYVASFPEPRLRLQVTSGGGTYPAWSADGKELFYVSADQKLMVVALTTGQKGLEPGPPRELMQLSGGYLVRIYDTGSDRNRILVQQRQPVSENIEVIVNWPEWVRKRRAIP